MAITRYDLLVVREDGEKNWWTKIGAAFENKSGDGYTLLFEALPMPGKDGQCKVVMKLPSSFPDERSSYRKEDRR